jgi:hypothetical protein
MNMIGHPDCYWGLTIDFNQIILYQPLQAVYNNHFIMQKSYKNCGNWHVHILKTYTHFVRVGSEDRTPTTGQKY